MTTLIVIVTVLVVLNGLFVAAEFAIVGTPRVAIEKRAAAGNRVAQKVRAILEEPQRQDRFIATAQLGITLASLGLGMYGEHQVAERLVHWLEGLGAARYVAAHTLASILAVAMLTYVHIVFGEMVPKSIALQRAERTVLLITPVMLVIQAICLPLVIVLNFLGNTLLRLIGITRQQRAHEHLYSPEELALIVSESEAGGMLREESGKLLRELFEFGDLTAREVMTPRVRLAALPLGADADTVTATVRRQPYTRYPVYDGDIDQLTGMVNVKDLLLLKSSGQPLSPTIVRPIPTVPDTATLDVVLETLRDARAQMAVVIDEHGGTAGVLTHEDLFDEVIGEVAEGAAERTSIYRDARGVLHVSGTSRVEEAGEALGVVLEHDEVDSVSGLILERLGRPPHVGDVVVYDHVRFEVVSVEGLGVNECIAEVEESPREDA
ncbi:hemolysin family protein [Luteitalea sp.]|jgi:CBS domain containing-hemolysin-like protein|uniref:hemolysin family protein n=1 Tax=Luteitalea sp. TaxID=2004800 RepID=UPI000A64F259|nr:hemolysin family protein [Luteitalea sp.]